MRLYDYRITLVGTVYVIIWIVLEVLIPYIMRALGVIFGCVALMMAIVQLVLISEYKREYVLSLLIIIGFTIWARLLFSYLIIPAILVFVISEIYYIRIIRGWESDDIDNS